MNNRSVYIPGPDNVQFIRLLFFLRRFVIHPKNNVEQHISDPMLGLNARFSDNFFFIPRLRSTN